MARGGATQTQRAVREERLLGISRDLLKEPRIKQVDLAKRYGVSPAQINMDVKLINARYRDAALIDTQERIGKQLAAYDAIKESHLPLAIEGKTRSAEVVMQALTGEAKLLGLEAPAKQDIKMDGGVRLEIIGVPEEAMP